jgi:5,10-methenyltetrahydromethanopterin hydrogenase
VNAIVPAVKQAAIKSVATYLDVATDTLRNASDSAQQLGKDAVSNIKKFFQKQ